MPRSRKSITSKSTPYIFMAILPLRLNLRTHRNKVMSTAKKYSITLSNGIFSHESEKSKFLTKTTVNLFK